MSQTIIVEGMTCGCCANSVESAIADLEGVANVSVERTENQATFDGDVEIEAIIKAVDDAGYTAKKLV